MPRKNILEQENLGFITTGRALKEHGMTPCLLKRIKSRREVPSRRFPDKEVILYEEEEVKIYAEGFGQHTIKKYRAIAERSRRTRARNQKNKEVTKKRHILIDLELNPDGWEEYDWESFDWSNYKEKHD